MLIEKVRDGKRGRKPYEVTYKWPGCYARFKMAASARRVLTSFADDFRRVRNFYESQKAASGTVQHCRLLNSGDRSHGFENMFLLLCSI